MRPVRLEYLVGLASEQQLAILGVETSGGDVHGFVLPIAEHPAAEGKPATGVFFRPAGSLHDAVERRERGNDEFSLGDLRYLLGKCTGDGCGVSAARRTLFRS